MSTTTTDTSSIDEKKATNTNTTTTSPGTAALSLFKSILSFGLIIIIGVFVLYGSRASQTGLIPTNTDYAPYTDIFGKLNPTTVNIDIVKKSADEVYSTKINFPIDENMKTMKDGFIGFVKKMIDGAKANSFTLYLGKTLQSILATNFSVINTIYQGMNSYVNESLMIFIGPIIMYFVLIATAVINAGYLVVLWFYNLSYLFSKKTVNQGKTEWTHESMWGLFNFPWAFLYIFISIILLFLAGFFIIPPVAIFVALYCFLFPVFLKSTNAKNNKPYGISNAILDTLKYKSRVIMIVLSLIIISNVASSFSSYALIGVIIAFFMLIFFTDVFKQTIPKGTDLSTLGLVETKPQTISDSYPE